MRAARIAELLQPFLGDAYCSEPSGPGEKSAVLSPQQLEHISTYVDILLHWNARINLTAIRDPEEIVTRHFGESLFTARHLFPIYPVSPAANALDVSVETRLADLGSGAGFPGLPIKLWAPGLSVTLIESNHKKASFLKEVVRTLTFTNVNIQNVRAQDLNETFDVVTLRAVERFSATLAIAARLMSPGARLALLIAQPQLDLAFAGLPSFQWERPILIPASASRVLLVGRHSIS